MMIESYQINLKKRFHYQYINNKGLKRDIFEFTGFLLACLDGSTEVVELLIDKYPHVIEQKDRDGLIGLAHACINNNIEVV